MLASTRCRHGGKDQAAIPTVLPPIENSADSPAGALANSFERHKYDVKDNVYVWRYGVRLRPDLYTGLNPLPYAEAQRMEWVLARELRSDGYAVWQK